MLLVRVDGRDIDVETTNSDGFDARAKAAANDGYTIGIRDLQEGKHVDQTAMLLSVLNNRAGGAAKANQPFVSLRLRLTSLRVAPDNAEVVEQFVGQFGNWIGDLTETGELAQAIKVGRVGLKIAPAADLLLTNVCVALEKQSAKLIDGGRDAQVAKLYCDADREWPGQGFRAEQSRAFQLAAQDLSSQENSAAITILERGIKVVDAASVTALKQCLESYLLSWSSAELARGELKTAATVLRTAVDQSLTPAELDGRIRYVLQESLATIDVADNPAIAAAWIKDYSALFPSATDLVEVVSGHVLRRIDTFAQAKEFAQARAYLTQHERWLSDKQRDEASAYLTSVEADLLVANN